MKKMAYLVALVYSMAAMAAGDYQAGEKKSVTCAACHGAQGVSSNPEWPSLAGQHRTYFIKQLRDFKMGSRNAAVMGPIVANLSDQDMEDLAIFYAKQPLPAGATPQRYLVRGEALYRGGDFDQHITACIACHGPTAMGNEQAGFPLLSGQQAKYSVLQLQQFKDKTRRNDVNSIMQDISARMSAEDMEAVAHYLSGLH